MTKIRIRFSEIQTFLKCRKKHEIEWVREIEPRKTDDKMVFGTWGHAAFKALFKGEDPVKEVEKEINAYREGKQYMPPLAEHMEMGSVAMECAEKAFKGFIKQYTPVAVEETLFYDYKEGVQLTGTPDLLARQISTGSLWLFDHKFRTNFRPPASEILNLQMFFYAKLLQLVHGIDVIGSRQLQIKPFAPKEPKITQKGTVSKQNITTDWKTYEAAIIAAGGNVNDYQDMKEKLSSHEFYDWDSATAYRTQEEIDLVWNTEILPAVENCLQARENNLHPSRTFDFGSCNFCPVQPICVAEMKDEDVSVLMSSSFKKKGEKSQFMILDFDA